MVAGVGTIAEGAGGHRWWARWEATEPCWDGAQTGLGLVENSMQVCWFPGQGMAIFLLLIGPGALHVESCFAFCLEGTSHLENTGL